jgi:tetratricopeptide (TPR) repeat protein
MRRAHLVLAFVPLLLSGLEPAAATPPVAVIPAEREDLLREMLVGGQPAGCRLESVDVDRAIVRAHYTCGTAPASLELHHPAAHPDDPRAGAIGTSHFVVRAGTPPPPPALLQAVAAQVRAREDGWTWAFSEGKRVPERASAEAPEEAPPKADPSPPVDPDAPPEADPPPPVDPDAPPEADPSPPVDPDAPPPFTAEQSDRYQEILDAYRRRRMPQAFDLALALARENPHHGTLGMLVASLAGQNLNPRAAEDWVTRADAQPDDPLLQFVAGVALHYTGHERARSEAEKRAYYERALVYLERARPDLDFEPRLYIYLAVSHFRLGHQEAAETFIEEAVQLGPHDPDAFYCRAEIYQHKDIERSLEDLDRYIEIMARNLAKGAMSTASKENRVLRMKAHLEAVARGDADPEEIFDPVGTLADKLAAAAIDRPAPFLAAAALAGLILVGAAVGWIRRRRVRGAGTTP